MMILFPVVPFNVRLIEDPCNRLECKKTLSDQDHSCGLDRLGNNQVTMVWKRIDFTPRIARQDHGFAYQSYRRYRNKEFNMLKILISSCLLGIPVRYDGQSKPVQHPWLRQWHDEGRLIAICPELAGGLPTPRPPAERTHNRIMTEDRTDVTDAFTHGARQTLALCQQQGIQIALLKESSPSCGSTNIYDGEFRGRKIPGMGLTTEWLRRAGMTVFSENQIDELADFLRKLEK